MEPKAFRPDAFGRITKTFPSTLFENYGYDAANHLTSKTDRKNQQITYTYDQLNRLTQKTYPDSTTVNYMYDNDSHMRQVTDPTGTYAFTFDNMGRLSNATSTYSFLTTKHFTDVYGYDAASNRTSFTDPEGGATAYVKVAVYEDSGNPDNWHVERRTCGGTWTSKNGQSFQYNNIPDCDALYNQSYHPKGPVNKTCWSCPATLPTRMPKDPKVTIVP